MHMDLSGQKGTGRPPGRLAVSLIVTFQVLVLLYFIIPRDAIPSVQSGAPIQSSVYEEPAEFPESADTKDSTQAYEEHLSAVSTSSLVQDEEETLTVSTSSHQDAESTSTVSTSSHQTTRSTSTRSTSSHRTAKSTSTVLEKVEQPSPLPEDVRFIIAFGDSWTTVRFHSELTGPGSKKNPSARNPFGNPKWPGATTSKGKNWLGYMASEFNSTLTLCWNFAQHGSFIDWGIVPSWSANKLSISQQIQEFNNTIGHRPDYAPWTPENSVASIWFGLNDMTNSREWTNLTDVLPKLVDGLLTQAQVLHDDLGFRNFLFFELGPVPWAPFYQTGMPFQRNKLASYYIGTFNVLLQNRLRRFKERNSDARINMITVTDIIMEAVLNPQAWGAANATCIDERRGEKCLWGDKSHPGRSIHRSIAERAAEAAWGSEEPWSL